jgi:hypothetical protein
MLPVAPTAVRATIREDHRQRDPDGPRQLCDSDRPPQQRDHNRPPRRCGPRSAKTSGDAIATGRSTTGRSTTGRRPPATTMTGRVPSAASSAMGGHIGAVCAAHVTNMVPVMILIVITIGVPRH